MSGKQNILDKHSRLNNLITLKRNQPFSNCMYLENSFKELLLSNATSE